MLSGAEAPWRYLACFADFLVVISAGSGGGSVVVSTWPATMVVGSAWRLSTVSPVPGVQPSGSICQISLWSE